MMRKDMPRPKYVGASKGESEPDEDESVDFEREFAPQIESSDED
jgi:hypothetical protein